MRRIVKTAAAFARRRPRSSEEDGRFWIESLSNLPLESDREIRSLFFFKARGWLDRTEGGSRIPVRNSEMATSVINILIEIVRGDRREAIEA